MERFYVGLHQPSDAQHFALACVSISRLHRRRSPFPASGWMLDSGAFKELEIHGRYRHTVAEYAERAVRWATVGDLHAIVAQDYMCEPFMLERTGLSIAEHQRLTIARFDELCAAVRAARCETYVLPVLQGYAASDYVRHLAAYGDRLGLGAWVGVGSVCKRQGNPALIAGVLSAIRRERPDLRMHGFGVKTTALRHPAVRHMLWSADSMAWSYAARKEGRDANSWREASRFSARITRPDIGEQAPLFA